MLRAKKERVWRNIHPLLDQGKLISPDLSPMKMRTNTLLGTAAIPNNGGELRFYQRGEDFAIEVVGIDGDLMNSAVHGSEELLAEMALKRLASPLMARVLVGGLGMGFTLRAALKHTGSKSQVVVAELVPEVIEWNKGPLGEKAGNPMQDPRALVREGDVAVIIRERKEAYDTILLDTDNGPEGLTQNDNRKIYSSAGIRAIHDCLRTGGVLAVWSTHPDKPFSRRLGMGGFRVEEVQVPAMGTKGTRHTLWFAKKLPPERKGPQRR